jgi:DNA-directed RNA polymerase III subunit RPC4
MPPARGAGRGRGRGRGRGGAAAADGPAVDGVVKQEVKEEPDASSTDTLMATPPVELAPEAAPVAPMLVDSTSSSMSPASAPTETPAPTPVRPPVQRLETLGLSARGQLGAPRGPSGVGRGTGRAMAGKFKPKAVRRGIEERAQAEAEEKARREEREKEAWQAENAARGNLRGRWMRGRGRGDAMGRGGPSDRGRSAATGLFSVAPSGEKSGT